MQPMGGSPPGGGRRGSEPMLEELNGLPGVLGSMRCDAEGQPVTHALPPEELDAGLREAAVAATDSLRALRTATGVASHVDLQQANRRVLVVPAGDGSVVVVCAKTANTRQLLPAIDRVLRRAGVQHEPMAAGPAAPARAPQPGQARPPPRPAPRPAREAGPRVTPFWRSPFALAGGGALLILVAAMVWWVATRPATETAGAASPAAAPGGAATTVLRIGGAKSFAAELAPALAKAYLESLELGDVKIAKLEAQRFAVQGVRDGSPVAIAIEGMNTPDGFAELAAGRLDVAMAGRRIRPEWQQKLESFGPMMMPGREHVVALSGIAVIVNQANQVPRLDRKQLAGIFGGGVVDWSELTGRRGGRPSPVTVYAGDDKMGLTDLFRTLVLDKTPYTSQAQRLSTLQGINDAVAADPQGIGYVTLPFVRGTRAVPVSEGDETPLLPTAFTIGTEDYFLSHRLYFYVVPRPDNPHLVKFIQFALGAEGQAVVKKSGYVELSVAASSREAPAGAPAEYLQLTQGATRLSSTLRFESGSTDFDTRALVDLERVTAYLIEGRLKGPEVRVLGFSDSQGDPAVNRGLSLARADQVAKALAQRGITGVAVSGFGPILPVASNATREGRDRNRRVEIWVAR